ncbi:transient receptor potential cation channel subfamily V member 6-like [Clavelina lepadiformis]
MKKWNKFFYRNTKNVDPDSQWKQQNEQMQKNEIYKMVDFSGGGNFLKVYDQNPDDSPEVKKQRIQEYFDSFIKPFYLFEDGEIVTEETYQKWHNQQTQVTKKHLEKKERKTMTTILTITQSPIVETDGLDTLSFTSNLTLDSVIRPFNEHKAKWKLEHRGAIGETPLHMLFLNGSPKHIEVARALLEKHPQLAWDLYEGFEYYGESCLHFAVINGNIEAVKLLLETGHIDIHARARGKFFIPVDVKRGDIKLRKHKFEGYAYYGEYPLSFAASTGNHKIYDMLIDHGADPNKQDRNGNSVLHLTVIHDQPDMYYYAVKHVKSKADPNVMNFTNLSPLALAAKLGRVKMFKKILEISSQHHWSYNTVTCFAYPLKSLDTIGPNGETDWNSALMMIIRGKKDNHLELVADGVVHQLLNKKWKEFGQMKFYRLLASFVLHILFLSVALYLRPNTASDLRYGTTATDIARYVFECLVILIVILVLYYLVREIYLESLFGFWQNVATIPSRIFYQVSCILLLLCIPFRFAELYSVEDWLLVFAVPGVWSYMLFFLRNWELTGPFITMIYKIFGSDIVRFAVIYGIIIGTLGIAFFYQFEGQNVDAFLTEHGTFMTLFQMSFGEFSYSDVMAGKYPAVSIILFIIFMMLVHILLLNMLIAMMTRTYEKITQRSKKVWRRQWASMVVVMERSHRINEKLKFQSSYGISINAERITSEGEVGVNPLHEVKPDDRALMVIHHQKTSESERRRNIKKSWQGISQQAKQRSEETPEPKLKIHGISGMVDFVTDSPNVDEVQDESLMSRIRSAVSTSHVSFADEDSSEENDYMV